MTPHPAPRLPALAVAAVVFTAPVLPRPVSSQELPRTWQEQQDFRSGPTPFEPLMEFWYDLDAMSELM
ncbi:MAG TPA: hypothetical protein VK858_06985, partial [Longimicrobiales bacterium]|nr:hypothetical protein [Longimicrobiales bacterium]